jgi:hypothetical protein
MWKLSLHHFKKIGFDPDNCFIKDLDFDRFIASKFLD